MKILQIGCGGIGSFLVEKVAKKVEQGQINVYHQISIADPDMVELEQLKYQNFADGDVGKNKAQAISTRFKVFGEKFFKTIKKRIDTTKQLKDYDLIILCVDNETTRAMVIKYCHKNKKEFIDLRATGRRVFAMPKEKTLQENMKFVDVKDMKEYSCQDKSDLEKGFVQVGNEIVAVVGVQMLLNHLRVHNNRIISLVV